MEEEGSLVQPLTTTCNPNPLFQFDLTSLSSAQALLLNPSTSIDTIHSTVDSLLLSLPHLSTNATSLSLALSVLAQSAPLHPSLSQSIVSSVRSLINGQDRTSSAVLSALLSIATSCHNEDGSSILTSILDEDLVLSLASSGVYKIRSRILRLLVFVVGRWKCSGKFLTDEVMVRVFLRFTGDIYPVLRRDAIDGLCEFLTVARDGVDFCVPECCLEHAIGLIGDDDEFVRVAAVRMVGLCGEMLGEKENGVDKTGQMDTIFTQICSMARDMSVKVRIEAFNALGKVKLVSDAVLMQSLSKKILGSKNGGKSIIKLDKASKPCAAGAYIHGIEDEFYVVRKSACRSLGIHAVMSFKFADDSINYLMDLMNDDSESVRLEALDSLFRMAAQGCLNVQEKHVHMFLGLLTDMSSLVRHGARKILQLMKLPKLEIFKSTVNKLIANLEKYPEEEEGIFFSLFSLGKNHREFSLNVAKDLAKQIERTSKGDLTFAKPSMAATLVVCIASPLSENENVPDTPVVLFSYAVPLLGRISRALQGTFDQHFLLTFLLDHSNIKWKSRDLMPEIVSKGISEDLMQSVIKFISKSVGDAWSLIKGSNGNDAEKILRSCMKELEIISLNASQAAITTLDFFSKYIQILQLISKIQCKFDFRNSTTFHIKSHHILLEKLDSALRKIRYSFTGWTKEVECHILELSLLVDVFTFSLARIPSNEYLKNLLSKISHLEAISCLSDFTKEIKRLIEERSSVMVNLHSLLKVFECSGLEFVREMKPIKAELKVVGDDSENPLTFVPGLPAGIRLWITLHNTSSTDRLWLHMSVRGRRPQYVFLDLSNFEGSEEVRKCSSLIPFYETPKVASFEIRVCIVIECLSEHYEVLKERGGPKYDVTELSVEKLVYFSSVKSR
ncbi:Integrator complex subunit 4 [Rhynchospora pubera]|uniref:Integrator complex subunit 4 n=1 Tax=Rhynchospora pubera TaxID=906938 RepID=A0AAV8D650_9POAL|nr:Integrator complex subunit 4 [Rhynchospora pubera]